MIHPDVQARFWSKVDKISSPYGCWLWTASLAGGWYGKFFYSGKLAPSHRVVWEWLRGPIPKGKKVLHNCPGGDNPRCCNPKHLWLGSQKDNVHDMHAKGRARSNSPYGENHQRATLTSAQVTAIRRRYAGGCVSRETLAEEFGTTWGIVSNIVWGHSWKRQDRCLLLRTVARVLRDRHRFVRHPTGEKHHMYRLTDDQIRSIRIQYSAGASQQSIASTLGVSQGLVSMVILRKNRFACVD